MAKISRRAVASSSSSSYSATLSSSSSSSATYAASSAPSSAESLTSTATSNRYSSVYSLENRKNANNPINDRKSIRSLPSAASSRFIDTPLVNGGYGSGVPPTVAATPDPLRNADGSQFTTTTSHNNVYAYTTTTTGPNKYTPYTASPLPPDKFNKTIADPIQNEREIIRRQFFATYDVMTGVRIAATLGGFFGLMVFLIVWKSRSSSNETLKVLKDPKMAAVAAVCMQEEEEREIQEAMVATGMSIYPDEYDTILYRRQRMLSLGNVSAPPMLNRGFRFSSVGGGYSSLLEPPRRFSFSAASGALSIGGGSYAGSRRRSGSETSRIFSNYPMGSSFGTDDYFMETDDEFDPGDFQQRVAATELVDEVGKQHHKRSDSTKSKQGFLEVPLMGQDSRRSSAMTCCSTDSSYLERRCSAFTLGLSNLPPSLQRKCSTASRASSTEMWDYYYPDIQVIQPTPKPSPCPSERSIYEQLQTQSQQPQIQQQQTQASKTTTTTSTIPMETTLRGTTTVTTAASSKLAKPVTSLASTLSTAKGTATDKQFIRKHSIAYYDPESNQSGRKQQIHSISADTVDVYPYNQPLTERGIYDATTPAQSAPPVGIHQGFRFSDSPTEELRLNVRRKIAVVELPRIPYPEQDTPPSLVGMTLENNNSFPYLNSAAAKAAANAANSSSISIDSTPLSIDKLNGSGSLGTVSAKALFNADRRAPLASLSSFKISSLEYQDSEMRSLDEDSVFLESVADTDEDMQQLSSDSEEVSLNEFEEEAHSMQHAQGYQGPVGINTGKDVSILTGGVGSAVGRSDVAEGDTKTGGSERYSAERHLSQDCPGKANLISSGMATGISGIPATASAKARRSLLQRHRTVSVSSSDRVALLSQPLQEFYSSGGQTPNSSLDSKQMPLETHFGAIICTNSPPSMPRRAQLLQQYSDPQSQTTTTTTTTTTNTTTTEDETCSTLNTEVGMGVETIGDLRDSLTTGSNETLGLSTTTRGSSLTHHSSVNTIVSFGRISPLTDTNPQAEDQLVMHHNSHHQQLQSQQQQQQQLPVSPLTTIQYDPCASSISDSFIHTTKETVIKMPSSLKSLILHKPSKATISDPTSTPLHANIATVEAVVMSLKTPITISRSATNLTYTDTIPHARSRKDHDDDDDEDDSTGGGGDDNNDTHIYETRRSPCPSVMLELPLIKLPTEDSSSSICLFQHQGDEDGTLSPCTSKSDEHQPFDPSLPSTSRKWSKETLF